MNYFESKNSPPGYFDGNEWRVLGRIKTSRPKFRVSPFSKYMNSQQIPLLNLDEIGQYDRYQEAIPILDQMSIGSCVAHATATAVMKVRDLAGMSYVPLSPDSLYAQIDDGVDMGSDPADAMTQITAPDGNGICTLEDVPDIFVFWTQISDAAKKNALRFRTFSEAIYSFNSFNEMVTADYLGFATIFTVNVGPNFEPNRLGIAGYYPGQANHCVAGGEALIKLADSTWAYRFRNSWNTSWPQLLPKGMRPGCALVTAAHIDKQPGFEGFAIRSLLDDPNDLRQPPDSI